MKAAGYKIPQMVVEKVTEVEEFPITLKVCVSNMGSKMSHEQHVTVIKDGKGYSHPEQGAESHKSLKEAVNCLVCKISEEVTKSLK